MWVGCTTTYHQFSYVFCSTKAISAGIVTSDIWRLLEISSTISRQKLGWVIHPLISMPWPDPIKAHCDWMCLKTCWEIWAHAAGCRDHAWYPGCVGSVVGWIPDINWCSLGVFMAKHMAKHMAKKRRAVSARWFSMLKNCHEFASIDHQDNQIDISEASEATSPLDTGAMDLDFNQQLNQHSPRTSPMFSPRVPGLKGGFGWIRRTTFHEYS